MTIKKRDTLKDNKSINGIDNNNSSNNNKNNDERILGNSGRTNSGYTSPNTSVSGDSNSRTSGSSGSSGSSSGGGDSTCSSGDSHINHTTSTTNPTKTTMMKDDTPRESFPTLSNNDSSTTGTNSLSPSPPPLPPPPPPPPEVTSPSIRFADDLKGESSSPSSSPPPLRRHHLIERQRLEAAAEAAGNVRHGILNGRGSIGNAGGRRGSIATTNSGFVSNASSRDDSLGIFSSDDAPEPVVENASYPNRMAFSVKKSYRQNSHGDNLSVASRRDLHENLERMSEAGSVCGDNDPNGDNSSHSTFQFAPDGSIDFTKDPKREMTWGRRIALKLLYSSWYNPRADQNLVYGDVLYDDGGGSDGDNQRVVITGLDTAEEDGGAALHDSSDLSFLRSSSGHQASDDKDSQDKTVPLTKRKKRKLKRRMKKRLKRQQRAALESGSDNNDYEVEQQNLQPSLKKAWIYFEHVVLTRFVVHPHNTDVSSKNWFQRYRHSFTNFDEAFERAQPGEKYRRTQLYDFISTPHRQLGDFGMGFGLYFSTLRAIGYITFIGGFISFFNLYFFASDIYAEDQLGSPFLIGSAICTRTEWVPCVDCNCTIQEQGWNRTERCHTHNDTKTVWIVKNLCLEEPEHIWRLGIVNYVAMIFLLFAILGLDIYLRDQTIKFDEDEQTAQDYSIVIRNPPAKATDPDSWRRYFESTFDGVRVAAITCAVNNDLLVRALVKRREVLRMMELQLNPGTPMDIDHLALLAAKEAKSRYGFLKRCIALVVPGLPELLSRLVSLNTSIKGLAQLSYPCTNVFVTFEKEQDQREVLSKLNVGAMHIRRNNAKALPDRKYLFRNKHVLDAAEAVEPNSVRWQDLNVTVTERMDQMLVTFIITFGSILVVALLVTIADEYSKTFGAAFSIAGFNLAFPEFAKLITSLEAHPNESQFQTSLYFKIAIFRWVNTAMVITVITPFTHTLESEDGLIPEIYAIFFAEIVTTNVIQITDLWGHFQRHIVAPRASTQDTMNLCFQGLEVELAERYTNMTKIMFLAFWYSSIFPAALFLSSAALAVNYYTDRFSLMRSWKRSPHVGTEVSTISRYYFFSSACIFLAAMSSFYWAAFPFDNLCPADDKATNSSEFYNDYQSNTSIVVNDDVLDNVVLNEDTKLYRFCNQDYILKSSGPTFPFMYHERRDGGEWMSEDQKRLSTLFGWTSVAVISFVAAKFLFSLYNWIYMQFVGVYQAESVDQGIGFHEVRNINGYIPQVRSRIFSYPLIASKCDKIGQQLFDWTDPDRDYAYYDLTKDADHVLLGTTRRARNSFSRVKDWPPNRRVDDMKRRKRELEQRIQRSRSIFNSVPQTPLDTSTRSVGSFGKNHGSSVDVDRLNMNSNLRARKAALQVRQELEGINEEL